MELLFEIKNLSKSFKLNDVKSLAVLNDLNFSLPRIGLFAIYGKSGCGKSTLLTIMQGLMKPTKGGVFFCNKNVSKYSEKELNNYLNKDVGVIFQSFNLLNNLSIIDNLYLTSKIKKIVAKEKIYELLKKYKLFDLRNKKVSKLSGGEKQRVCLIRALINNPKVIFADEPTGNLDKDNTVLVMEELKELSHHRLIIIVSHNKKIVDKYCDGFLDLTNGTQYRYKPIDECETSFENTVLLKKDKHSFLSFALFNNFKNHIGKDLINYLSICFSITIILLSLSFQEGIKNNVYKLIEDFQNNNAYKVAKIKCESINDSNLTLEKTICPTNDEVEKIFSNYSNVENNASIDYFFSEKKEAKIYNKMIDGISFIPVNNIGDNNFVYVNNAFKERYQESFSGSCLNKTLTLNLSKDCILKNIDDEHPVIKEKFNLLLRFSIEKVKYEFSYLNNPKVYFSYSYFIKNISSKLAKEVSKIRGKDITFFDLINNADKNSDLSGYSRLVFLNEIKDVQSFNNHVREIKGFRITNEPFEVVDSFQSLSSSLFNGILFFIVVSCACSISIIGFLSYSSFIENQKQSAIFTILGATNNEIFLVYIFEQIIVALCSILTILPLFSLLVDKLNNMIYSLTFFKDIFEYNPNPFGVFLLILAVLSIIFIFTYLPLVLSKRKEIYKELQEE